MRNTYSSQPLCMHVSPIILWIFMLLLLLLWANPGFSQTSESTQVADTRIEFKIKTFGMQVKGRFTNFQIDVLFNDQTAKDSHIQARISVNSISTGISKRDKHLMTDDYFHEEEHPYIEFESTEILLLDDSSYLARGNLTIRGIQHSIEIPFRTEETKGVKTLMASFELNRLDYQVGGKNWTMGDIVKIAVSYRFEN